MARQWTNHEVKRLIELFPVAKWGTLLLNFPDRTQASIKLKGLSLGLSRPLKDKFKPPQMWRSKYGPIAEQHEPVIFGALR